MISDGYLVILESVMRDAQSDTRKMYENLLWAKDQEIAKLKKVIENLEDKLYKLELETGKRY